MSKLLLTGFEPFDGDTRNPSGEVAIALHGEELSRGLTVHGTELPVSGPDAVAQTLDLIREVQPQRVVMLGLAADRQAVTPERVAINLDDFQRPDNAGLCRRDEPIEPAGPDARFCTLESRRIVSQLANAGIPAELSYTAGTFVCNHLTYAVLSALARAGQDLPAGFVHLPWPSDWGKDVAHDIGFETMLRAVRTVCEAA